MAGFFRKGNGSSNILNLRLVNFWPVLSGNILDPDISTLSIIKL